MTATKRLRGLRQGLGALAKSCILAFGVPLAIERLWLVAGTLHGGDLLTNESFWIRAVLIVVAGLWCKALLNLLAELRRALHGGPQRRTNWSSRWASSIAALALIVTAGHASASNSTSRPAAMASHHVTSTPPVAADEPGRLQPGECLADLAARTLFEPERWSALAAANMGNLLGPGQRFVDPSLLRGEWCLAVPGVALATAGHRSETAGRRQGRNVLEEMSWLGLGVIGTAALVRRLRILRIAARAGRAHGERGRDRDLELEALEARLDPFGDAILIDWIEAANRLLRRMATELSISPLVILVRAGPAGVTFYFDDLPAATPEHFVVGANGHSWTLPLAATLAQVDVLSGDSGRYVPWLIPVGDDGRDAWLVAVGPGQSLEIAADDATTGEVLSGITTALRTLPWAEELAVELLGLDPPPIDEHCYQMAASSVAALADLASGTLSSRGASSTPGWRREPLIVSRHDEETQVLPTEVTKVVGVVRPGRTGRMRLLIDDDGARLVPVGVSLNVPRPGPDAMGLIDRLLARASTNPSVVAIDPPAAPGTGGAIPTSNNGIKLALLRDPPLAEGLRNRVDDRDAPRVTELLGYLVLHDGSASVDELMGALFPRAGARGTRRLDDVLAATRRALGDRRLVTSPSGDVRLDGGFSSDWTGLLATLGRARVAPVREAMEALRDVLSGLTWRRSPPYRWMTTEGLVDHLSFELCDSLHQLASLAFAEGDLELTAASLRAGLGIEPTSELLVRDLMLLRHRVDGTAGVIESYAELEEALAAIGGAEPSWTTRALFDDLAGEHA